MADIQLQSNVNPVDLQFTFNTPQDFFYTIEVLDDTRKQSFHDTGGTSSKTLFHLGPASNLVGLHLKITWTAIDRAGAGNNFLASAVAIQNGTQCINPQIFSGISNEESSSAQTVGKFV